MAYGGGGAGGRIRVSYNPVSGTNYYKGNYSTKGGLSRYEEDDLVDYGVWDEAQDYVDDIKVVRAPSGTSS